MQSAEEPSSSPPRYVRATLGTSVAIALLPGLLLWSGYTDYHSPGWDPNSDSGAVQGFVFFGIAAAMAFAFALVAFPAAAKFLHTRGRLLRFHFFKLLVAWLAALSVVLGLAVGGMLGSFVMFFPVSLMFFFIASLLVLPFAALWLRLAS